MKQRTFFDTELAADLQVKAAPRDPHVLPKDKPRLTGQNAAILKLLQQGPRTNAELSTVSLKYTSRISDLRAAGYTIDCRRGEGGVNTYALKESKW